jgi:hypothetical protein
MIFVSSFGAVVIKIVGVPAMEMESVSFVR